MRWAVLVILALVCFVPLLAESMPRARIPGASPALVVAVFATLGAIIAVHGRRERGQTALLALLALGMVFAHWVFVDRHPDKYGPSCRWAFELLDGQGDPPHQYRLLPYGFARALEYLLGDWWLTLVAYRWFFSYWFLRGWVEFVGRFTAERTAMLSTLILVPLYPFAVAWYYGQLTDPLHHTLFVYGLIAIVDGDVLRLAALVFLNMFAKETSVLLVLAWFAVHPRTIWQTLTLFALSTLAFVLARGIGWRPGFASLNGTDGLMITANLGIGPATVSSAVPLYHNYLHPLLFAMPFVPGIVRHGRGHDRRLIALACVVVPGILVSSLCFSWLYESRNYLPMLPILVALASLPSPRYSGERGRG